MVYKGELFSGRHSHAKRHARTHTVLFVSDVVYLLATLMLLEDDLLSMLAMSLILNAACALNLDMH